MDYVGDMFRPPSEAKSFLLQVTVGCSHNRCSFCAMYRGKTFKMKPLETILNDITEASRYRMAFKRVFLCDGDALILPQDRLVTILEAIRTRLPWVDRVGVYGDSRSILRKSIDELRALRELGLGIVYHGAESGSNTVLSAAQKGSSRENAHEAAVRLREAKIRHSVMFLLGLGGIEGSEEHARESARLLSDMDPLFASALTLTIVPESPLGEAHRSGKFRLPDPFAMLQELRILIAEAKLTKCHFAANHASNYLPITGRLSRERERMLCEIDDVLTDKNNTRLTPEWLRGL